MCSTRSTRQSADRSGTRGAATTSDILGRFLPNAQFNRLIEEMIEKEDPDKSVAWPHHPIPSWAADFRPRVFLDLGSGLGAETTAILTRLGQWGCLGELQSVIVVDRDVALHSDGAEGLKRFLETRILQTLQALDLRDVNVQAHVRELSVKPAADRTIDLVPLNEICPRADLILASHVTYYFGDGSGKELIDGVVRHHLSPGGKVWVNIRDLNCPAYGKRRAVLLALGIDDPQPLDYSEYFASMVLPSLPHVRLLDKASIEINIRLGVDRARATRLIMWRADLDEREEQSHPLIDAAGEISSRDGPVYSETQFILTPSS